MKTHEKYRLDRRSFAARAAIACLVAAVLFRGLGGLLDRTVFEDGFMTVEFLLPVVSSLLMIACVAFFGRRAFWTSVIPFVLLMMSFILRLFSFDNVQQIDLPLNLKLVSIFACLVFTCLYSATVFGARTKWAMFVLLFFAFGAHVRYELVPAFAEGARFAISPVLMEIGLILLMAAMFFITGGMTHKFRDYTAHAGAVKEPASAPEGKEKKLFGRKKKEPVAAAAESAVSAAAQGEVLPESEPAATHEVSSPVAPASDAPVPAAPAAVEEEEEDDPFAPSTGPIKLTLNPEGFTASEDGPAGEDNP